jgi:metallophosphoesterase (TIGR00282 family)
VRILMIGDIVGSPGRRLLAGRLRDFKRQEGIDLAIANAENADGGSGLTPVQYRELCAAGVDGVTMGDHIYRRKEIYSVLEGQSNIVRPANFPPDAPGREWMLVTGSSGDAVAVFSLLGRTFMRPVDCPFRAAERVLAQLPPEVKVILVDFHAEATGDKLLMGRFLDGRVSAVLGTHTHVATADECLLAGGTAFQCDVGMTGPHDGVLGRRFDRILETTLTFRPTPFDVSDGDVRMCGSIVDIDAQSGKATQIRRVVVKEE